MTKQTHKRLVGVAALCCATALASQPALAQISDNVIRIGVMNDQSGPYADNCGAGSTTSVKLAAEDFNNEINGAKIEIIVADDQNKPDIGVAIAKRWVEQDGVDAIVGCSASSIALAVQEVMAAAKKKMMSCQVGSGKKRNISWLTARDNTLSAPPA